MRFLQTFLRSAKAHVFTLAPHLQSLLCSLSSERYCSCFCNNVCKKPSVFQAAYFVYAALIVWSNKRILVYLHVFVIELPFYLARTGTDFLF